MESDVDRKLTGILGAAAALVTLNGASAGPAPVTSYRDLLEPVPNAIEALKADDARVDASESMETIKVAEWDHHHARSWRRYHHHHHNNWWRHHHHHNNRWRRERDHHHHHHHR